MGDSIQEGFYMHLSKLLGRADIEFHKIYALKKNHHPRLGKIESAAETMQHSWEPLIRSKAEQPIREGLIGTVYLINSGTHDSCLDNTMSDFLASTTHLISEMDQRLSPSDVVVWRTTSAAHPTNANASVLSRTEYSNSMNFARTHAFSRAGARVVSKWKSNKTGPVFKVLDVFPVTASGRSFLLPDDIRHFSGQMYHLWTTMLLELLCPS